MDSHAIAATVKLLRKKSHLSQHALAELAGVGKTVIYDIEKGKRTVRFDTLLQVFEVLNIKMELKTPIKIEENTK